MRLRVKRQFRIAPFLSDFATLVIPDVANTLEEQQREDVGLEISCIYRTAQDVRGLPEVAFELTKGD
ncbi:hypothetical protein D3C77_338080 [compost metagenome]